MGIGKRKIRCSYSYMQIRSVQLNPFTYFLHAGFTMPTTLCQVLAENDEDLPQEIWNDMRRNVERIDPCSDCPSCSWPGCCPTLPEASAGGKAPSSRIRRCRSARQGLPLLQAGSDGQVAVLAIRPSHTCTERKIFHSEQEVGCPRTISRAHSFPTIDLLLYNNNNNNNNNNNRTQPIRSRRK